MYVQSSTSQLDQLVKIFIVFSRISCKITVILILYIDQITFIPRCQEVHFLDVHFNIILKLFTRTSAALFAHTNISGTHSFCTSPLINLHFELT
jgi:hypothetical protein